MSEVTPIAGGGESTGIRAAIAQAAQRTGADFDYLLAQAKIESSLDPAARAPTSSAAGLYQFTQGTWLDTLERHGAQHGLGWAGTAIAGGKVRDPGLRAQIMALRFDPQASALMAGELAQDNRAALTGVLGREPDAAELYLAHFLGSEGATRLLSADAGQSAAALLPKAAAANRGIFYERGGPRTVGGVMDAAARQGVPRRWAATCSPPRRGEAGGWGARRSRAATLADARPLGLAAPAPTPPRRGGLSGTQPPRASMAETLRSAFALADPGQAAPAHVQAAYGQLRRFGL